MEERLGHLEAAVGANLRVRSPDEIGAAQAQMLAAQARGEIERLKRQNAARRGVGSRASARAQAERRIREIAGRGEPAPVRDDLFATLRREIDALSERQFLKAWSTAAPAAWKRPGAKRH